MRAYEKAAAFLPEGLQHAVLRVQISQQEKVQEIRLRRNGFLTLSLPEGEYTIDAAGVLSEKPCPLTVYCNSADIEKTFLKLCDYSVHSHSAEIKNGYVTAAGGFRAGVAGTAVIENGEVTVMRDITSLCLRVAGRHEGCACALRPLFEKGIPSLLIAGEPSAGKTSMLRDIARMLCEEGNGRRFRVSIVDERGEIAGLGGLENADVLTAVPKPIGILQALRTLAPDVILVDELGTLAEVEAIAENLHAGVPAIATAHCRNIEEAMRRPAVRLALERKIFDTVVFLRGRETPGSIREIVEVESLEMDRHAHFDRSRNMHRHYRHRTATQTHENVTEDTTMAVRF